MRNKEEEKQNAKNSKVAENHSEEKQKKGKHNSALYAASMGRSASAQVSHHSDRDLANTGTNISYEGATAPGAGGSAGTGYTSGKEGVDERINTDSDYDKARIEKPAKNKDKEPGKKK